MPHLLCMGMGYTARHLAREADADWQISGTCRAPARTGLHAYDWGQPLSPDLAQLLRRVTHLFITLPPQKEALAIPEELAENLTVCRWIGYCSTTGLYGDHQGGWVDETTPPCPSSPRSALRLQAETLWQNLAQARGIKLDIFRLSGIYGVGRSALDRLRRGVAQAIDKPDHVFNRIHVEDSAGALWRAIQTADQRAAISIYNLADDTPCSGLDVLDYAADLLHLPHLPRIPFAEATLSAAARAFYTDCRRIRNERLKTELGYRLRYPDYRTGLAACLEVEKQIC